MAMSSMTEGAFNLRRHKRRPTINITPLIDVLFLLLIFFMVSSTFRAHRALDVALPEAQTATAQDPAPLEVTVSASGEFHLGPRRVDEAGLRAALRGALESDPEAVVVLRADERAAFGPVVRAMDIARELGATRLIVPTRPWEGEPTDP